jgi:PAS domain S-box-containing protein
MTVTLRQRILVTLLPLLVLMFGVGGTAAALLYDLGGRIEAILHANYDSVLYMERLNESVERIDSSFQFALLGRDQKGRAQFEENWPTFREWVTKEGHNITEPGEQELADRLTVLAKRYGEQGQQFYGRPAGDPKRQEDYFGNGGLLDTFKEIKIVADQILRLNQKSMEKASHDARRTARHSLIGFAIGLTIAALLAVWLALGTAGRILQPIRALTESAAAIGTGNLDQVVPATSRDELGRLAEAFNTMARQLRHYRNTDYAKLLRAQRTSQATIDSFPDPVLVVDAQGEVTMANPAACRLLGIATRESKPAIPVGWNPPEELRQPLTEALRDQRPFLPQGFDRNLAVRTDGVEHSLLPRILPIRDPYGNTLGAAVLLQDVTRFRLLDEVKSNLVSTVSHELKTPLTGVRLALHLLLEETVGPLTPKQTELLLDARDNAERLLDRVNHLLDLARLEQKEVAIELRPEEPAALLEAAAEAVRPRAADKGVAVTVDVPPALPPLAADAPRLGHALGNLLDNAVTYTERGGKITLSAALAGDDMTLSVADTGKGIPAEYLPRVFDKFFRVPGASVPGGTGLGLAIVREIVQAHGGSVDCESTPGVGTTFRIHLPLWKGDAEQTATAAKEDGRGQ